MLLTVCTNLFRVGFCKVLADIALMRQVGLYCPVDNLLYIVQSSTAGLNTVATAGLGSCYRYYVVSGTGYTSVKPRSTYP